MAARPHPCRPVPLLAVVVAAACSGGGPTAATGPLPSATVLSGQVVEELAGAGLSGVRVEFAGATTETDADGRFLITGAPSTARRAVTLTGLAIHRRETYAADGATRFTALPVSFDMAAFDDVAREQSRTIRWVRSPSIYLDPRVVGGEPDPAEVSRWIAEIEALAPALVAEWTGGALASGQVVVGTAPPASGAIVLAFDESANYPNERVAGMTSVTWSGDGVIGSGRIRFRFSGIAGTAGTYARRAIIAHELGHALGLGHMDGGVLSVMAPVVRTPFLTVFDANAGRVLYGRPPGNVSVDRDARPNVSAGLSPAGVPAGTAEWSCPAALP